MFTISADQFVNLPVEEVAKAAVDRYFDYQPVWDPTIEALDPEGERTVGIGRRARVTRNFRGRTETGEATVTKWSPGHSLAVELRFRRANELRELSCHPLVNGGTRVHVEIASELRGLARWIAPLTRHVLSRGLANSMHELKVAVEQGASHG